MMLCSKPGCGRPVAAVLAYNYAERRASLEDAGNDPSPHTYGLCPPCADRLRPPVGWLLDDLRRDPPLFALRHRRAAKPWRDVHE